MFRAQKSIACFQLLLCGALLTACQDQATAPASRHVSQVDLDFITGLQDIVAFDRQVTGDELPRNPDPRVAKLAREIRAQDDAFYAKVMPVAERDGIRPPENSGLVKQSDMQTRVAALMANSRYDFDQEFLSDEIAASTEVLQRAENSIAEPAGDPALRQLVQEGAQDLQNNIARLKALQGELAH